MLNASRREEALLPWNLSFSLFVLLFPDGWTWIIERVFQWNSMPESLSSNASRRQIVAQFRRFWESFQWKSEFPEDFH